MYFTLELFIKVFVSFVLVFQVYLILFEGFFIVENCQDQTKRKPSSLDLWCYY